MNEEIYNVVAKLFLSTRKKSNRLLNIVEIADEITWLKDKLGGLIQVSEELKLTTGMLNQFLSVYKLNEQVKNLVRDRKIDSVAVVYNLSKFSIVDQTEIVDYILDKKINSQDLKALIPLRKRYPDDNITDIVNRHINSKNTKISVIQFYPVDLKKTKEALENELIYIVGKNNLHSIELSEIPFLIKLTKEGENILRNESKKRKITLQELIQKLLN